MANQPSLSEPLSEPPEPLPLSAALLSQALNSVPTAVYIKDRQHRLLYANAACRRLWGLPESAPEELSELSEAEVFSAVSTQHLQQLDDWLFQGYASKAQGIAVDAKQGDYRLMRRTELAAGGSLLLCYLEKTTASTPEAVSETGMLWTFSEGQTLLDSVPAMVYQLRREENGDIRFTFVSSGAMDILGIAPARIQADASLVLDHLHPLDRPGFENQLATTEAAWRWQGRYYPPNGDLRWLQVSACAHPAPGDGAVWNSLMVDITSQKQAAAANLEQAVMEQALADSEARFRTIAATIPGALFQLRLQPSEWSMDYISDRIEGIAGIPAAVIMADVQQWLSHVHPFDQDRLVTGLKAAATSLSPWQFEGRFTAPDGRIRWWRSDAVPLAHPHETVVFCGVILDITARKEIEEAYQENERRLRMALGVSGMGVWTWNRDTDKITWTTEGSTVFGIQTSARRQTFNDYVRTLHPDDQAAFRQATGQALVQAQDYRIEYRIPLADGTLRWIGERGGPWHAPDGAVMGLAATVVDITDRKTAHAALAESEQRYRTLLDNLPGAVYRCQAHQPRLILVQSEAIADITGYPLADAIHRTAWQLVHPEDLQTVEGEIAAAVENCRSFELEYRILHADGSIRWIRDTGQPISQPAGTVRFIDGVLTDITRRKQSETRFRELAQREALINRISSQIRESLELIPVLQTTVTAVRTQLEADRVVVYRFRPDWSGEVVVEDVLSPWLSTIGQSGADNCFPNGYAECYESGRVRAIDDIYQAGLDECHLEFLESLQVRASLIVPILLKRKLWGLLIAHECRGVRHWAGSEIELLISLAGQAGIAIGQADLYRQATENAARAQQQAENLEATLIELQRTQAQLVQTEKMSSLGQLVAGVAHEINNPVSFIDGNISHAWEYAQGLLALVRQYQAQYPQPRPELAALMDTLDLEFIAKDFPKLLESMRIGAERIKAIVKSLRIFSRMDEADIKAVDIHDGLESTLMILQHRFKANGDRPPIELRRSYGQLPPVECYAGQLNQVFMNLISNALDAIEEHLHLQSLHYPPEISITTEQTSADWISIKIADNGPGMPEDTKRRIFEPFYTTKPIGKGTGIGLSISYQIVTERHHGRLECDSEPDQGTRFHIQIPVRQTFAPS